MKWKVCAHVMVSVVVAFVFGITDVARAELWQLSGDDIYYNTGKVGIGTSSPSQDLEVAGNIQLDTALYFATGISGILCARTIWDYDGFRISVMDASQNYYTPMSFTTGAKKGDAGKYAYVTFKMIDAVEIYDGDLIIHDGVLKGGDVYTGTYIGGIYSRRTIYDPDGFRLSMKDASGAYYKPFSLTTGAKGTDVNDAFATFEDLNAVKIVDGDLYVEDGKIGIGTDTPAFPLTIKGGTTTDIHSQHDLVVVDTIGTSRIGAYFNQKGLSMCASDNSYAELYAYHYGTGAIDLVLNEPGANVLVGTTSGKSGYKLAVDGKIVCEELLVEDSGDWADYVFEPDYDLMPLNKVEQYVKQNKHLPGIPSAEEVKVNGLQVGHMQAKLLEKIEELTLYVIELKKENDQLKKRMEILEITGLAK